ncbi:MAG: diaminopimelate decarboxylase, partial [Lachnospiraceae bacterium]|nr:diaminopimelate decarboxylase [Lachnospiraceae bacterium]
MRSYIEESNFFKGINPEEIAKKYGTPVYVYNEENIREHMRAVANVITKYPYRANYSMKANSNLSILKMALEEGLNADAMSEGEMRLLIKAGFPSDRIFFVPNNVDKSELQFAIDNDIMVSLDSLDQLDLFGQLNPGGKCSVRINPGVGAGHHEKVVTAGKKTKFGVAEEDVDKIFEIAKKYNLTIAEINQHVGSQYLDPEPFLQAVENFLRIAEKFDSLEYIDFGGGYGIPYHKLDDEAKFDMASFTERFTALLDAYAEKHKDNLPLFKSEPGRYCVAEGGVILGRVHATKQNAGKRYAGTDIGMNVLARPTLYDSYHEIEVLHDGKAVSRD